nr:MAG TPA: hypothetical protein [Caudoviricetes sp.]
MSDNQSRLSKLPGYKNVSNTQVKISLNTDQTQRKIRNHANGHITPRT